MWLITGESVHFWGERGKAQPYREHLVKCLEKSSGYGKLD